MDRRDDKYNIVTIRGFSVYFPKGRKPFASQLALMSKFLVGVQKRENCLLESPTGTGKTTALLCAALAWQRRHKEEGAMVTESDMESEEEEGHETISNAGNKDQPVRSFDDFRFMEFKDHGSAARSKHGQKGKSPVELTYEETAALRGNMTSRGHAKQRLMDDNDDVFESPRRKRSKSLSGALPLSNGKRGANGDLGEEIHMSAAAAGGQALAVTPDTSFNAVGKVHSVKSNKTSKRSAGESISIAKTSKERRKRKTKIKRKRPRRVYFCSRTHSQLEQVVAELRKCVEACPDLSAVRVEEDGKALKMSLLASRKSTCINKTACNDPKGVDDACKRLLKENACLYFRRAKYSPTEMPPVWDVEEAVRQGKKNRTCVYQITRDALVTADIVLSPYNYVVDPAVREVMGIKLKDAVVIFDEAHNLEDMAREAASTRLSLRALSNAAGEMQRLGSKYPSLALAYSALRRVVVGIKEFLEEKEATLPLHTYEAAHEVFNGTEALGLMQSRAGVTLESLRQLKDALHTVVNEEATDSPYNGDLEADSFNQDHGGNVLSSGALQLTSSLVKVLGFLLAEGMENVEHYKMVVLRERASWQPADAARGSGRGVARNRGRGGVGEGYGTGGAMEMYLCFWCLSASVCFSEIDKLAHSTVLTSGTLSPLDSFAGELGIDFPHRLEAPHVINVAKQCLVTSVGLSGGIPLDGRFDNRNALGYQDALGEALLQYARVVPGGLLAFFPSYGLLDKTHNRWKATGLLQALEGTKAVFLEPKGQGKIGGVLAKFYEAVKGPRKPSSEGGSFQTMPQRRPPSSEGGALMLAVARGKVSEGIDFSDHAARMCMIIGIPYPSAGDLQVKLKKEYQDQCRKKNPRLVDGRAWYDLQAFRAVNQAVGRCIRHRSDFGAIVLCDPRYSSKPAATASLSKWVRSSVKQTRTVEASLPLVESFFQHHGAQQQNKSEPKITTKPSADPLQERPYNSTDDAAGGGCGDDRAKRRDEKQSTNFVKASNTLRAWLQPLPQVIESPEEAKNTGDSPPAEKKRGMFAGPEQKFNGRTALRSATISTTQGKVVSPSNVIVSTAAAPRRRDRGFYCRSPECVGGALVSEPIGDTAEPCLSDPRRVSVQESHLCRVAQAVVAADASMASTVANADFFHPCVLLEAPKSWVLGECVSEGEGRWVADDGVVYVPLFCSCVGCCRTQVGEKAVGAGEGGFDLIGRAWFFTSRVEAEDLDSANSVRLVLPTQVAKIKATPTSPLA